MEPITIHNLSLPPDPSHRPPQVRKDDHQSSQGRRQGKEHAPKDIAESAPGQKSDDESSPDDSDRIVGTLFDVEV